MVKIATFYTELLEGVFFFTLLYKDPVTVSCADFALLYVHLSAFLVMAWLQVHFIETICYPHLSLFIMLKSVGRWYSGIWGALIASMRTIN